MRSAYAMVGMCAVVVTMVAACSSSADPLYVPRTRTDTTQGAPVDRDDPNPRPDPPSSGGNTNPTPAPPPANDTDAGSATPKPAPAPEGSCTNPRCFGFGGTCGCQGGDAVMGCENGQCACGDLVFDDSGGCGLIADQNTLKALFSGCLCN